jgi:poly-gamma-glutamate synthase PgsB/CapB
MTTNAVRRHLTQALHPAWVRLHEEALVEVEKGFILWAEARELASGKSAEDDGDVLPYLVDYLIHYIKQSLTGLTQLDSRFAGFRQRYSYAASREEQQGHIIDFARDMGATPRQLRADRKAFARWFGDDAIAERYTRQRAERERKIVFVLGRLGLLSASLLSGSGDDANAARLWRRLKLEALILPLLGYSGEVRMRSEAFICLATALQALPVNMQETSLTDSTLKYIYRSALERRQHVWIQCEALSLLKSLSLSSLDMALENRLLKPGEGDDLFVRRHAVRLLGARLAAGAELAHLAERVVDDASPAVRQVLPGALMAAPAALVEQLLARLLDADPEPAVRASALLAIPGLLLRQDLFSPMRQAVVQLLGHEHDSFVLRVALQVVVQGHRQLGALPEYSQQWEQAIYPLLADLHRQADSLAVRRWAAAAREQLWSEGDAQRRSLRAELNTALQSVPSGSTATMKRQLLREHDEATVGRTLSLLAQQDFGFDLKRHGWMHRLTRGHRFGFRLWRFLHELRNPSTDKRQSFRHTTGRVFRGTLRAPSGIVSELAQTKVPGEPLFMDSEAGWRPYLPLVDEVISSLDQPFGAGPLAIYTSEGVTEIEPPHSVLRRLRSRLTLTNNFAHYARLRNWHEDGSGKPQEFLDSLVELGFKTRFRPHQAPDGESWSADPAVLRFFPALLPFPVADVAERMQDYFFSVYENSLQDLGLFLAGMTAWFVGRHLYLSAVIRNTRRSIPLVIGGWGTRGKSGTERIKAALFNALGHSVVSKTSGCEAMFLHAHPGGKLREMFLFRPYDKATIWEQVDVLRISRQLGTHVFLWECMGLTPSYVSILQQQWVKDDLSTITNTYPDHEDLQGPAGINIPEVMTNFIPHDGTLITSEEQMEPILREAARQRNTAYRSVDWLEAGLLTPDLLARFPYAEHPYNIALVIKMGEELGIDADFAIKEMADRVVPDLGVLKASPPAPLQGRVLEFINGMSANERFGCLGNFERMNFTQQDPYQEPGIWLSSVVNNRADRVARSRVFSSILVNDISVDRHVLIGTNLDGLLNYIREDWAAYAESLTLWPDSGSAQPLEILEQAARRMRIPFREEHLGGRLLAMLQGLGVTAELDALGQLWASPEDLVARLEKYEPAERVAELQTHITQLADSYREYQAFEARLAAAGETVDTALDDAFRALLWTWFERKLVVVEDSRTSGNRIIQLITQHTPPGLHNRIMGMQNIKGTGLDYVYRWQAWEACYQACQDLKSRDRAVAESGLRALSAFQEYGVLCDAYVRASVAEVRHSQGAQNELFQGELSIILSNLESAMQRVNAELSMSGGSGSGVMTSLLVHVEAFLDAGDAVKRRKKANQIYRDLGAERISHERAALELQALTKRQKGGWLQHRLGEILYPLRAREESAEP